MADEVAVQKVVTVAVSEEAAAIKWTEFLQPDAVLCDDAMPNYSGKFSVGLSQSLSPVALLQHAEAAHHLV
jgi:CheY-like chemotaxis protein